MEEMGIIKAQLKSIAVAIAGIALACGCGTGHAQSVDHYQNFSSAIFLQVPDMRRMATDPRYRDESYNLIHSAIKFDTVWLETYVDGQTTDEADVLKVKQFFDSKGIKTFGGIMADGDGTGNHSFCWADPEQREKFLNVVSYTAKTFNEIIFDDMFMYNCLGEMDQKARGTRGWTEYRLDELADIAAMTVKTAKGVNPNITLILKPPNWYDEYQFSGYNMAVEPKLFNMIYTGNETRDAENTVQYLQSYQSFGLVRYFEHLKPGEMGGGWVDFGAASLDRVKEQFEDTLLAKAKQITIWHWSDLVQSLQEPDGSSKLTGLNADLAGNSFENLDAILGKLGTPKGVASYKPPNSSGEMYLQSYLGMIGIPMDMYPDFPADRDTILLTEQAKADPQIVDKIWQQLNAGKTVVMTNGLVKALQGKGMDQLVDVEDNGRTVITNKFAFKRRIGEEPNNYYCSQSDIIMPQIAYGIVDIDPIIQAIYKDDSRSPVLLQLQGLLKGRLFILVIPENDSDLYQLPQEILTQIRKELMGDVPVYLDSPSKISLFTYDNNTFVTRSYLTNASRYKIVIKKPSTKLFDLQTGAELHGYVDGDTTVFEVLQMPSSYVAYRFE
jgi:hypothetical protein